MRYSRKDLRPRRVVHRNALQAAALLTFIITVATIRADERTPTRHDRQPERGGLHDERLNQQQLPRQEQRVARTMRGDPEAGRAALRARGCGSCHTIPGVGGAHGLVGPPLTGIADRAYLAGVLPNTPTEMARWIRDPQEVARTVMPSLGIGDAEARDMVAYLYTLRAKPLLLRMILRGLGLSVIDISDQPEAGTTRGGR